jgi:hypothetical protein
MCVIEFNGNATSLKCPKNFDHFRLCSLATFLHRLSAQFLRDLQVFQLDRSVHDFTEFGSTNENVE